jgi:hypothetical protein
MDALDESRTQMTALGNCPGCKRTWNGNRACHCSSCHRHFSGLTSFDAHRSGQCLDPGTLTSENGDLLYRQDENDMWRSNKEWIR